MKAAEIQVGGKYFAKVSGNVVGVQVLRQRTQTGYGRTNDRTVWDCRNMITGREITVKSAQRFRGPVPEKS